MPTFISAVIEPIYEEARAVGQRRRAPDAFLWQGERFDVVETVMHWSESGDPWWRRRTWRNQRQHVSSMGRDYYRVRTADGRLFDLYYDRRLQGRELGGDWVLWRELAPGEA